MCINYRENGTVEYIECGSLLERAERAEAQQDVYHALVEEWVGNKKNWVERAERAEGEVERLHRVVETGQFVWREAAERAEAEVERLLGLGKIVEAEVERLQLALSGVTESFVAEQLVAERALADGLAEALREALSFITEDFAENAWKTIARWEEARRG